MSYLLPYWGNFIVLRTEEMLGTPIPFPPVQVHVHNEAGHLARPIVEKSDEDPDTSGILGIASCRIFPDLLRSGGKHCAGTGAAGCYGKLGQRLMRLHGG
jgi:hypothetical protein